MAIRVTHYKYEGYQVTVEPVNAKGDPLDGLRKNYLEDFKWCGVISGHSKIMGITKLHNTREGAKHEAFMLVDDGFEEK